MSGEATRDDAPLPSSGNDAYAATLDEVSRRLGGEASTWSEIDRYLLSSRLKVAVFPEGVAQAVYCFAADLSAKTTGEILDVEANNALASER